MFHYYSSPHSLSTCQSFLFSTNQWKWPIHVPFSFFMLNQFLSFVAYHIQWHQGSRRICRHLANISKSCDLTARGQGHFTQSQMVAWGMYDVCLCALLTLQETGSPVFCWQFKAGKVAGAVNKPKSQQLSISKQLDKAVVTTRERPWAPNPDSVT